MAAPASVAGAGGGAGEPLPRRVTAGVRSSLRCGDLIRWLGRAGALLPVLALGFILVVLLVEAIPAIRYNGWHFFTGSVWNEGTGYNAKVVTTNGVKHLSGATFGALPEIVGTIGTSVIALVVAVPVSIGAALFIVERLPRRLAGVPSVVIGLWGAVTFGPFIAHHVAPFIASNMPDVPVLSYFKGATGNGEGMLVSGLVLAIMVIPIVAATTRDLIRQVPVLPREG